MILAGCGGVGSGGGGAGGVGGAGDGSGANTGAAIGLKEFRLILMGLCSTGLISKKGCLKNTHATSAACKNSDMLRPMWLEALFRDGCDSKVFVSLFF